MSQLAHSFADPDALMRRASDMIQAGRLGVARPLLAAIRAACTGKPGGSPISRPNLQIREGRHGRGAGGARRRAGPARRRNPGAPQAAGGAADHALLSIWQGRPRMRPRP